MGLVEMTGEKITTMEEALAATLVKISTNAPDKKNACDLHRLMA